MLLSLIVFNLQRIIFQGSPQVFGDFKIGGQVIRTVKYADNFVLLAKKETVLQGIIIFVSWCNSP